VSFALRADNVSFRYSPRGPLVVDGVSLRLDEGGVVGIIGPNGSGKTTLLRLLSGTRQPSHGRVWLGGTAMDELSRRDVARQIAVVPQATELAFEYRTLEIVLMGRHPHLGIFAVEGAADVQVAMQSLDATGTAHLADRYFHTLSGGERQRVVIAAALAQAANVLLLDEPTASLDLGYQLEVATTLQRLNRDHRVTMAISTHDLNLAASMCRELVLMRDGRVIAVGPTDQVLTPERVSQLYDVEADVHRHAASGHLTVTPLRRLGRHDAGSGR
jgi:iron complex transport system ATP-binding protein